MTIILPILRERVTHMPYQYLESFKTIFLEILREKPSHVSRPIRLMKPSQRIAYFKEEPHVDPWVLWEGEDGPWRAMWARMDFVGPPQLAPP